MGALGALGSAFGLSSSKSKTSVTNPYLQSIWGTLSGNLATESSENPYLTAAQSYYGQVFDPNYQALSDSQINNMYNNVAANLQEDFAKGENNLAGRIARSGLSGSRIASKALANQSNANNKTLANLAGNLANQNALLTNQNKQSALSSAPSFASAYNNNQYAYLAPWMSLGQLVSGLNTTKGKLSSLSFGLGAKGAS
jgi:hypothetical protein